VPPTDDLEQLSLTPCLLVEQVLFSLRHRRTRTNHKHTRERYRSTSTVGTQCLCTNDAYQSISSYSTS
jgi:hypothetical protein